MVGGRSLEYIGSIVVFDIAQILLLSELLQFPSLDDVVDGLEWK
jgi:hypothetical protein